MSNPGVGDCHLLFLACTSAWCMQVDLLPALVADEQAKAAAVSGRGSSSYEPLVVQPGKVVLQHAAAQMEAEFRHGKFEWGAMMRWYHREKAKGKRGEAARGGDSPQR